MTSDNDFCVWGWHYRKRHSRVRVNAQTITRNAPRICALITSRNDRHVWTDRNSFTGISTEMIKMLFYLCFCQKNTHKTHKMVKVAVINDNNNFAPSLFRSLCEFIGDCFGPRYFSSGAALPQKNTSVQNNHLRFHTMTSKKMVRSYYCLSKVCWCPQMPTLPISEGGSLVIFVHFDTQIIALGKFVPLKAKFHVTLKPPYFLDVNVGISVMSVTLHPLKKCRVWLWKGLFKPAWNRFWTLEILELIIL